MERSKIPEHTHYINPIIPKDEVKPKEQTEVSQHSRISKTFNATFSTANPLYANKKDRQLKTYFTINPKQEDVDSQTSEEFNILEDDDTEQVDLITSSESVTKIANDILKLKPLADKLKQLKSKKQTLETSIEDKRDVETLKTEHQKVEERLKKLDPDTKFKEAQTRLDSLKNELKKLQVEQLKRSAEKTKNDKQKNVLKNSFKALAFDLTPKFLEPLFNRFSEYTKNIKELESKAEEIQSQMNSNQKKIEKTKKDIESLGKSIKNSKSKFESIQEMKEKIKIQISIKEEIIKVEKKVQTVIEQIKQESEPAATVTYAGSGQFKNVYRLEVKKEVYEQLITEIKNVNNINKIHQELLIEEGATHIQLAFIESKGLELPPEEIEGIQIMSKLNKAHVPKTIGILLINGQPKIFQEYVSENLETMQLTPEEVEKASEDILDMVYEMNEKAGVVHRDIKPDNILVKRGLNGVLKLYFGDFGLASTKESPKAERGNITQGPPEYVRNIYSYDKEASNHTDIFMTGLMLWQLKTGNMKQTDLPFSMDVYTNGKVDLQKKIIQRNIKERMNLDPGLWKDVSLRDQVLIKGMLHPDPEQRFTHEQIRAHKKMYTPEDQQKFEEDLKKQLTDIESTTEAYIKK